MFAQSARGCGHEWSGVGYCACYVVSTWWMAQHNEKRYPIRRDTSIPVNNKLIEYINPADIYMMIKTHEKFFALLMAS